MQQITLGGATRVSLASDGLPWGSTMHEFLGNICIVVTFVLNPPTCLIVE